MNNYKHVFAQFKHRWKISLLSSVGIVLSALCLVIAGHLTQMATSAVMQKLEKHGGNHITVMIHNGATMSQKDIATSLRHIPHLLNTQVIASAYIEIESENIPIIGIHPNDQTFFQLNATEGRLLHSHDHQPYAVFSDDLIQYLKKNNIAISVPQQILGNVGVIESIGISNDYQLPLTNHCPNGAIFVSLDTFATLFPNNPSFNTLAIKVDEFKNLSKVSEMVGKILDKDYPEISFSTIDPTMMHNLTTSTLLMVKSLIYLFVIICASLGGIGIMNMTIANISTRHTELALRVSFGATLKQIRQMLIFESTLLCLSGATIGIILGLIAVRVIAYTMQWPFVFVTATVINSLIFAVTVGILASLYPTRIIKNIPIAAILKGD